MDYAAAVVAARAALAGGATAVDLNGDGQTDYRVTRDGGGNILREELDLDQDGTAEMIWDFTGTTKTYREDRDHDGTPERTWDVTADTTDPTIVTYITARDTSGDGQVDYRVTYTVDPTADEVTLQLEEDVDLDGTFDWEESATTTRVQHAIASVSTSGPNACTPEKKPHLR